MPKTINQPVAEYKFAGDLIPPILDGLKTGTVRCNDERTLQPGDYVAATTKDGRQFATLKVRGAARVPLVQALQFIGMMDCNHGASTPNDLQSRLAEHYPDVDLSMGAPVHAVAFEVVDDA